MEFWLPLELFRESQAPCRAVCRPCGFFRMMHGGVSDPSCSAFVHRVAFEVVSGHRVLIKSGPENLGRSACGTTRVTRLEFARETSLIPRCEGRPGTPSRQHRGINSPVALRRGEMAQMKWCRDPRCSPRGNPACRVTLGGHTKGVRCHFALQGGTWDFP